MGAAARSPGRSIAARLFLSAALWSLLILVVAGIGLSAIYRRTAEQAFDERLGVYLRAIVAEVATPGDDARGPQLGDPRFELPLSGWYWEINPLDKTGEIKTSRSLFASRLPRLADLGVKAGLGGARRGTVEGPDGKRLRQVEREIDAGDEGSFLVQVAATPEAVESQIANFNLALAATFGLLLLALVGSTALQVRFGLRPLRRLQEGVAEIRRGDSERIEGSYPPDLAPLAGELNLLIASNREIVERARTHVGNLAHALKTPLSVLKNEAGAQAAPLADKVREQIGVMRDQVDYHLERARAAARSGVIGSATDVAPVVASLTRTFEKIYRDQHIAFEGEAAADLRFRGEKQDLEEMLGNLVDNAGKWADARVRIEVAAEPRRDAADRAFLTAVIDDDGPGLPEASRAAALERGRRIDQTKPGSGLGLSIVTDLAGVYGGALTLSDSPLGGLRATLRLPAALGG